MAEITPQALFRKTDKGNLEIRNRSLGLARDVGLVFLSVDGKSSAGDLLTRSGMSADRFYGALETLMSQGFIAQAAESVASPTPARGHEAGPSVGSVTDRARELRERVQATRRAREDEERKTRGATDPGGQARTDVAKRTGETFPMLELGEDVEACAADTGGTTPPEGAWTQAAAVVSSPEALAEPSRAALVRDHALVARATSEDASATVLPAASPSGLTLERNRPLREKVNVDRVAYDLLAESAHRPLQFVSVPAPDATKHWDVVGDDAARAARRRRSRIASWIASIVLLVAIALPLFGVLWLQFIPLSGYIAEAEQTLSQRLGQPVTVSSVRYVLLPTARLILGGVTIGTQPSIRAERIEAHASPLAMIEEPRHFGRIEATNLVVPAAMLTTMQSWSIGNVSDVRVERLRLANARLEGEGLASESFDGEVFFDSNGTVKETRLENDRLKIQLMPQAGGVAFQVDGNAWTLPAGAPLKFSFFTARGVLRDGQLAVNDFTGRAAGGAVQGTLTARWPGPSSVQGTFAVRSMKLEELLPMLTEDIASTGTLDASGRYELQGNNAEALIASLRSDMSLTASRGELVNLDLLRGFLSPGATSSRGGRTPFDTLTGSLQVSPAGYSYRQLRLSSGPFNANGTLDVAGDGKLSGHFNAELVFETHVAARSSFGVTGTTKQPAVKR